MSTVQSSTIHVKQRKINQRKWDRRLGIVAIVTIVIAWFIGSLLGEADLELSLREAMPEATSFDRVTDTIYAASDSAEAQLGYVGIGTEDGYGGPLTIAVAVDMEGTVLNTTIVEQSETPSFMTRVLDSGLIESLTGSTYADSLSLDEDVDAVSGATITSRAIVDSVRQSVHEIAGDQLGYAVPPPEQPAIKIGPKELILVALFAIGYVAHQRKFKYTSQLRWAAMLIGLVTLGFIYNSSFTITYINQLLLGFWPDWHTQLYWYILLGGILFVFTVDNKNPYCQWFCPFGAAQECMAVIGGAKVRTPHHYRWRLKWLQRGLAWLAIILAVLLRNPGVTSFEIFGTLFTFVGSPTQFALLGLIMMGALYWKRPWCNYICPIDPITDFMRMIRTWVAEIWQTLRKKNPASAS